MRKEARILEVNLEAKLVDYSKLAASLQSTTRSSFDSSRGTPEGKPPHHSNRPLSSCAPSSFAPTC
ncbi:unnamed protein product [Chondrus crispus]|uniref:Uncharacterized protein n=1 Tax=Chondrus crispus TaxID=2769 RepID=R7Q8D1_CHOCR|nr:unnamed protein product [Chondrus crispus]CDF33740.1 unnamed protein product [Chondrus crispus]|eukprot:XP_005713559.1 unnamed protein product [Chondrus crispus]